MAKLKTMTTADVYKYIAVAARDRKRYGELVQLVGAQVMGLLAGLAVGDEQPGAHAHDVGGCMLGDHVQSVAHNKP